MKWIKAWQKLPYEDGLYLCELEEHYGLFEFIDGKFHPNDWGEYRAYTLTSAFHGDESSISHWAKLPEFMTMTLQDIEEIKMLSKKRKKMKKLLKELPEKELP